MRLRKRGDQALIHHSKVPSSGHILYCRREHIYYQNGWTNHALFLWPMTQGRFIDKISANQKNRQDRIYKEKIAAQRSNVKIGEEKEH